MLENQRKKSCSDFHEKPIEKRRLSWVLHHTRTHTRCKSFLWTFASFRVDLCTQQNFGFGFFHCRELTVRQKSHSLEDGMMVFVLFNFRFYLCGSCCATAEWRSFRHRTFKTSSDKLWLNREHRERPIKIATRKTNVRSNMDASIDAHEIERERKEKRCTCIQPHW